jgi:hypothetical protein
MINSRQKPPQILPSKTPFPNPQEKMHQARENVRDIHCRSIVRGIHRVRKERQGSCTPAESSTADPPDWYAAGTVPLIPSLKSSQTQFPQQW